MDFFELDAILSDVVVVAVSSQDMKIRLVLLGSRFLFFFVLVSIAFSGM